MTNEMKLLLALCDALEFDVEESRDHKDKRISKESAMSIINRPAGVTDDVYVASRFGVYDIDESGMYLCRIKCPATDFKLTKRADGNQLYVFGDSSIEISGSAFNRGPNDKDE